MNARTELKMFKIELDENQLCLLDTIISTVRSDHKADWANNSEHEVIRSLIKSKIEELF